jgi:hypothetical protein
MEVKRQWRQMLSQAKPYLFNVACQVIEAYSECCWNILICDDASARLPAAFLQELFNLSGLNLPLVHICANAVGRLQTSREVYQAYAKRLLQDVPEPRALLISEAAGDCNGLHYLFGLFRPLVTEIDAAVVASYYRPPAQFGNVYVGGYGKQFAVRAIYEAFESVRVPSSHSGGCEEVLPGAVLAGMRPAPLPGEPFIRIARNPRARALSAYCLREMKELAAEYHRIEADEARLIPLFG